MHSFLLPLVLKVFVEATEWATMEGLLFVCTCIDTPCNVTKCLTYVEFKDSTILSI